jgi:hypothetical protein
VRRDSPHVLTLPVSGYTQARMLRNRADLRTLGFLVSYAALVIGQWVLAPSGWLGVALIVLTCVISWICAVIAHNTVHCPVFKQR